MTPPPFAALVRLALLRRDALDGFPAGRAGLLQALAPWIAVTLVSTVVLAAGGTFGEATRDLLGAAIPVLAPLVISHVLAARWEREEQWWRYAVAFTWAQWLMPLVFVATLLGMGFLSALGLPGDTVRILGAAAMLTYLVAVQWLLTRGGLALSSARSVVMILAVHLGTGLLLLGPLLLLSRLQDA